MTDKQIDEAHIAVLKQIRETNRRFMDHTDPECPHGITVSALDKAIAALERQQERGNEALEALNRIATKAIDYDPEEVVNDEEIIRQALERQRVPSITERQLASAINILSIDNDLATPDYQLASDIFAAAPEPD